MGPNRSHRHGVEPFSVNRWDNRVLNSYQQPTKETANAPDLTEATVMPFMAIKPWQESNEKMIIATSFVEPKMRIVTVGMASASVMQELHMHP
ncbi:hypothetical protein E3N88_19656 [Mikania micrantha]|uniref:Uncharacterized protein n=1 Tax=Mikania micrantha TaxID=192012 RepID=A0A5N6NQH6_9ASTR|nr:hypothetical protein E3N88_19656 [Mikania micrantha]